METANPIGTKLLDLRLERGETQEQVADSIGISYVSLSRYETGQRMPKMNILSRLADHYGVTVDEIMGREKPEEEAPQEVPRTLEARIVSFGMDQLPKEERNKIISVLQAMYVNNPDLFKRGNADDR